MEAALASLARARRGRDPPGLQHHHPVGSQRRRPTCCRFPRCSRPPRCTSIWCKQGAAHVDGPRRRDRLGARGASFRAARRLRRRGDPPVPRARDARRRCTSRCPEIDPKESQKRFIKAICKGLYKVMSKMGISTYQSYCGAQIFEAVGLQKAFVDKYFTGTASNIEGIGLFEVAEEAARLHQLAFGDDPLLRDALDAGGEYTYRVRGEEHMWTPDSIAKLQHAARANTLLDVQEYAALINEQSAQAEDAARPVRVQDRRAHAGAARRGRAGEGDRQALRHRRDEPRLDLDRGAHHARGRDEPHRRQVEHRRRRRGRDALSRRDARRQEHGQGRRHAVVDHRQGRRRAGHSVEGRRQPALEDQAGRFRALRRDRRIPRVGGPAPDQDGAGCEARRRRPAARAQGVRVHRAAALLGARCRPDLAAAASRHLFDRGSRAADPRPEERESEGVDLGQARLRSGSGHGRRRRCEGQGRSRDDRGSRRRHRRIAGVVDQARGHAVGAGARRDAADARAESPARSHRRAGGRPDEDGPRRRDRRAARRGRIRLRDGAARRRRLHHDAQVPSQHLPGRRRHAGSRAAEALHRAAGARRQLLLLRRRRAARDHGRARLPHAERDDRPRRSARHEEGHRALEGEGPRFLARLPPAGHAARGRALPLRIAGPRPGARARPSADRGRGAGARKKPAGAPHVQDPQRAPVGRCDAVRHGRAPCTGTKGCRDGHAARRVRRHRGPELRRVPRARHHVRAAGRDERLRRQGALGRAHRRLSGSRVPGEARGEHRHRQHGDVRRDRRRSVFPRRRGRALLRAQFGRGRRRRRHRRSRLRIHDRRHRRRARPHRAQFRRRDERRRRLRLRRGRHVRVALQPGDGRARAACMSESEQHKAERELAAAGKGRAAAHGARRRSDPARADRAPSALHRLDARARDARSLGCGAREVRQGVPERIRARALGNAREGAAREAGAGCRRTKAAA